jgi:hypothetical protein
MSRSGGLQQVLQVRLTTQKHHHRLHKVCKMKVLQDNLRAILTRRACLITMCATVIFPRIPPCSPNDPLEIANSTYHKV